VIKDRARTVLAVIGQKNGREVISGPSNPVALTILVARKVASALLVGAAFFMAMPAVAQASPAPAKITISSDIFPTGATVPGGLSGTVPVTGGSSVTLTAPDYVYQPSNPPGTLGTVYEFMFWDVNSTLVNTGTATFTAPAAGTAFTAGAWYLPVCVVSSSCGGGGPSSVTTWAFSLNNDKVLPNTPISSVSPSSAWTSPSTSVSTATAVQIDALQLLGAHSKFFGTEFRSWFVFGGEGSTVSGLELQVPAGESPYAIAFYNQYNSHLPPVPCIGYPHCI
jgi:hypothetical protein